jgi:single-strand DNA-binding protein
MASLNKVLLIGNLTREPELRYTPSGAAVCELGLAMNRRYVANNQEKEETCFVDIVVWGKQAESSQRYLQKGSSAMIEGRLQFDQWEDRESGAKRSKLRVVAERVQFLNTRSNASSSENSYQGQSNNQANNQSNYQDRPSANNFQGQNGNGNNSYGAPAGANAPAHGNSNFPPMPEKAFSADSVEDDIPF